MDASQCIGFSREYLAQEQGFDLADLTVRKTFRDAVKATFDPQGRFSVELDEMGVIHRTSNRTRKQYESFIRVFAAVKQIDFQRLSDLKAIYPNAYIDYVRANKETGLLKVEVVVARRWADSEWAKK